jgi:hypothetical protein
VYERRRNVTCLRRIVARRRGGGRRASWQTVLPITTRHPGKGLSRLSHSLAYFGETIRKTINQATRSVTRTPPTSSRSRASAGIGSVGPPGALKAGTCPSGRSSVGERNDLEAPACPTARLRFGNTLDATGSCSRRPPTTGGDSVIPLASPSRHRTITYVLMGTVEPRRQQQNGVIISTGDVQWMTAGRHITRRCEKGIPRTCTASALGQPPLLAQMSPRCQESGRDRWWRRTAAVRIVCSYLGTKGDRPGDR